MDVRAQTALNGYAYNVYAAKVDPVITLGTTDEAGLAGFALQPPVGACDLQRGICGIAAGVSKEHMVEVARA